MSSSYWIIILGLIYLILAPQDCQGQLCQDDLFGDICIVYVSSQSMTWQNAKDYCHTEYQGDLVSIEDGTRQQDIENLMSKHSATLVWTGGSEELIDHWTWGSVNKVAQQQGCFSEDSSSFEFRFSPQPRIENATSGLCVPSCNFYDFKYAGLRGGSGCYCSNSYGKYGLSTDCDQTCVGNPDELCGGTSANSVHIVGGSYAGWSDNQPNNANGNQYCACLQRSGNTGLQDEPCNNGYPYICEVPDVSCEGINTDSDGTYHVISINRCYFVSNSGLTWQNARQDCRDRNGDLASLTTEYLQQEVIRISSGTSNNKLWIGLSRIEFRWPTGVMQYTNFAAQNPSSPPGHCVQILASDSYQWSDARCDLSRSFYCQFDITKISTTTTTTTTTTTPIPTTTTTTTPIPTTTTTTPQPTTTTTTPTTTTPTTTSTTTTPAPTTTTTTQTTSTTTTLSTAATTAEETTEVPATPSTTSATTTTGGGDSGSGQVNTPEAGQATGDDNSNRTVIIVVLVILIVLVIVVILCIIIVVVFRRKREKRKALQPNEFIPYTSNVDIKDYMSGPTFNVTPRPDRHVKFSKTSHSTQTSDHNPVNNYTKHMALQKDGTVSDLDSGISEAPQPVITISREQKAKSKPPHTPIVYHENETAKRKHGRYTQNRTLSPSSAREFDSDTGLERSSRHQLQSSVYDSDTNARHGRRTRSNKVCHSDTEMTDDVYNRGTTPTMDFTSDSENRRKGRLYRVSKDPEPSKAQSRLDMIYGNGKSHTSDTDDTARYEHKQSNLSSDMVSEDKRNPKSSKSKDAEEKRKNKAEDEKKHASDIESERHYKKSKPKREPERIVMSTTDDSESEMRKVAVHMKVFLETDDEENPATGGSKKKKLKMCPECNQRVRMLWKHLVSQHNMAPGSSQLQEAMERSKTMDKKGGRA